jgi:peptide deformylase
MPEYSLRKLGDPILREECQEVTDFSDLDGLLIAMFKAMYREVYRKGGHGIAAPQVGDNRRVFLTHIDNKVEIYINPEFVSVEGDEAIDEERCLSLPGVKVKQKPRYRTVEMIYQDEKGDMHFRKFSGFSAIVLQHELDHLDGILMTDYQEEKRDYSVQ